MKLNIPKHLEKHLTPQELEITNNSPFCIDEVNQIVKYLEPLSEKAAKAFLASSILSMTLLDGSDPIEVACRMVNIAEIAEKKV